MNGEMAMATKTGSACSFCGRGTDDPAEYHPYEFCVLFKAGQTRETIWDFIVKSQAYLGGRRGTFLNLREVSSHSGDA